MSGLSEIDIRDWEKVDFKLINSPIINRNYPDPGDLFDLWETFQKQVEEIRDKQLAEYNKRIPAILRKIDGIK